MSLNPFWCGYIFQSFYNGFEKKDCPIVLHYIVLPLILYEDTRKLFQSITKNASLSGIVEQNPIAFLDLQQRVWNLRKQANMSLINLHNINKIRLNSKVEILESVQYYQYNYEIKTYLRSANYLGKLIREHGTSEIFKILKVIP